MTGHTHRQMVLQPWMPKQQADATNLVPRFSSSPDGVQFQSRTCCIHPLLKDHAVKP
jgi:hypothetical protein